MLGDIIIAEPNAYIAFAGKRVTLKKTVPDGSQAAESLFIRATQSYHLHGFLPLNQDSKKIFKKIEILHFQMGSIALASVLFLCSE
ncbi:hypothetical protein IEQ34_024810 [Dendrobium chrysotoxum]|uniref:Uncharacterized protein n=1 Tax=Dendrobium chrysotoxum TaxID=161865 RepID=A0AAV7FR71_DENCH|nr:hypothetical protein IEQ34_024810 [Dendrobium chrysotoxum]